MTPLRSSLTLTAALAIGTAFLGIGCGGGGSCPGPDCPCPTDARLEDGRCCIGWTEPAGDVCELRPLSMPSPIGEPGAEDPTLRIGGDGMLLAAWVEASMETEEVVIAEEGEAGAFTFHRPGETLPGRGTRPTIAVGEDAGALVTWTEQDASTGVVYLAERDGDGSWSWPTTDTPLSLPPTANQPLPLIAPSGETLVVWNQGRDPGFGVAIATRAPGKDADLERPIRPDDVLSPLVDFSNAPQVAVATNGDALVTWYQSNGGPRMVYVSERFRQGGTFSRPEPDAFISPPGAPVEDHPVRNPTAAIHDRGAAAVVWTQRNGKGAVPVYLATRDGLGHWTVPEDLADTFSVPMGNASGPLVEFGPEGDLTLAWSHDSGDGPRILMAHRESSGTWTFSGEQPLAVSTPGAAALDPQLAMANDGAAALVWTERHEDRWRIALRRREPDGSWAAIEIVSLATDEDATEPSVTIGPDGRTIIGYLQGPALARRLHLVETQR